MRGTFVLVLLAGAAAAYGYSKWNDPGDAPDPATEQRVRAENVAPGSAAPDATPDEAAAAMPAVASRVEELLAQGDAEGAAKALLRGGPRALENPAARRSAFLTADDLARQAETSRGKAGTPLRSRAREVYSALYDCDTASTEELDRAFEACRKLHRALLFGNGAPEEFVHRHKVRPGDRLWKLARGDWKERGVTAAPGFVLHVNGISDARKIRTGKVLRVPLEPVSLLIRKGGFELTVRLGGAPVERFPVGIGADESTPAGTFRVGTMQEKPTWYTDGRRIPYGHADHIIGSRWIGFEGAVEAEGIGIHGTADESSVGKAQSMGCIRMRKADVERLFLWVKAGTTVIVRD